MAAGRLGKSLKCHQTGGEIFIFSTGILQPEHKATRNPEVSIGTENFRRSPNSASSSEKGILTLFFLPSVFSYPDPKRRRGVRGPYGSPLKGPSSPISGTVIPIGWGDSPLISALYPPSS